MDPVSVTLAILQVVRVGAELIERYNRGELSDAEYVQAWSDMQSKLRQANQRWEAAEE